MPALSSPSAGQPVVSSAPLTLLVYRSKALARFDGEALHALAEGARERNRRRGVTGLLVHDRGRFIQWLEGPTDAVHGLMERIAADPRHEEIDIVVDAAATRRVFGTWDMHLGVRVQSAAPGAMPMSSALLATLHSHRELLPSLLAQVAPFAEDDIARVNGAANAGSASAVTGAELARLLLRSGTEAWAETALQLCAMDASGPSQLADVVEYTARALGDHWEDDDCNEFEVMVGLHRAHRLFRQISASWAPPQLQTAGANARLSVLVAPLPGEPHFQRALLDAELLWRTGWTVQCEFPKDDDELAALLAAQHHDALVLSVSDALRRDHWVERVRTSIARARAASRNPSLSVVVGGRLFADDRNAWRRVEADARSRAASSLIATLQRTVPRTTRPA